MNESETKIIIRLREGTRDGEVLPVIIHDDGSPERWTAFLDTNEYYYESGEFDEGGLPIFNHRPGAQGPLSTP